MTQKYFIPGDQRVYAIGDIHGHLNALETMYTAIENDLASAPDAQAHIIHLGDYIDRGPDSRRVIETLIRQKSCEDGIIRHFLLGNHERGLLSFLEDPVPHNWLDWGGVETAQSYGVRASPQNREDAARKMKKHLPPEHLTFMETLELHIKIGDYVFAHAGTDPYKSLEDQAPRDLFFIREPFLSWHESVDYKPLPYKTVHGHTIEEQPQNLPHRIGVDTGCYKTGTLTAAVLEGQDVRFLQVKT